MGYEGICNFLNLQAKEMGIKNIIFDLGVVLFNLDYQRTAQSFERLGVRNFDKQISYLGQKGLFDDFETGKIGAEEFFNEIRKIAGFELKDQDIRDSWNAMLLDLPAHRINMLRRLQGSYRLFLLSNTNIVHIEAFNPIIDGLYGKDTLQSLFEKVYFSNEIRMRKPDPEIFRYVLSDSGLEASETLFIDDLQKNTLAAAELGINTIWLEQGTEVADLMKPYMQRALSGTEI
jgi:glucose-1-phosphatase